jgi:hypothetical protein
MTTYNTLKKIIPPDQALANQALSRSLRQVKDIFNTDLPTLSAAVSQLESNRDLNLINALTEPVPAVVTSIVNTLATGTGPGNTITINDLIGTAAGATINSSLPEVTTVVSDLQSMGELNALTANAGTPGSINNGIYTVMTYCLAGAYTSDDGMGNYFVTIPQNNNIANTPVSYASANTPNPAIDAAFSTTLIPNANIVIANIASNNSNVAILSNDACNACAQQLNLNVINCTAAGIEIGNIVNDIANANLVANSITTSLGLASQLHDIGLDVEEGGAAQFFEQVANTNNITGQAVIASMREGRNIAVLNAVGIQLDTQLVDVNANTTVANNLGDGQYTVAQAQANIII